MIVLQCISVLFLFGLGVSGVMQLLKSLQKNDAAEFIVCTLGTMSMFFGMYYTAIQINL